LTPIFGGLKLIKDIRLQQFLSIILNHIKKNPENWLLGGGAPQPFKI
jgi:hypothetical protein